MTRRVFFSFHYDRDVWRAAQVRNNWLTKPNRDASGLWKAADWEHIQREGKEAAMRWIREQLKGCSVTIVLIGTETSRSEYVRYEIQRTCATDMGLIGVYIHNIKDMNQRTAVKGKDPFVAMGLRKFRTYDWVDDKGASHLGDWVEAAYQRARMRNK